MASTDAPADPADASWGPDLLGDDFESTTLDLEADAEGPVVATLVRHRPGRLRHPLSPIGPATGTDVLYLHGWSDYFFQGHLAEFWHSVGARFYALDLRKYGRSLREHQTPGYITDFATYDEEIEAALTRMGHGRGGADRPFRRRLVVMGHSTGGLIWSLWAARNPGRVNAVVLNSPWLELQTGGAGRAFIAPLVQLGARMQPLGNLPQIDLGFYSRSISKLTGGDWSFNPLWRPERGFPAHRAWFGAVIAGQTLVQAGLAIDAPVLTLLSARSTILLRWTEQMRTSDSVLVVDDIARQATHLGPNLTVVRLEGAVHDIFLSHEAVREEAYRQLRRWLRGYL
ncbi:alpha/beta hydrolase [Cryobacterium melibiosiphilum]|uniref:Alpha/beta hydrolase n=1 Tax=Cryobacterium melibiosiphilum TaxID=995039 RepID=A0A3A5M895_9MICO|nr:alpha/beta hydrolase [Cryobacterium melibiosiphilum]RJT85180.1 alpha/beta hydrolase [Cryobacterium melibiosiphilum]